MLLLRKRPYTAFAGSMQGDISSSGPGTEKSLNATPPAGVSPGGGPCHSLEVRRVHSDTLSSRRSLSCILQPLNSITMLEQMPLGRVASPGGMSGLQHRAQMELLGFAPSRRSVASRRGKGSGDLSKAARSDLVAAQVKDEESMGPGDEDILTSKWGSSNPWRSTNTSASSQTHTIQRLTRLDTTAWQIAYSELKFSRLIGEGSFGRVFLGKWRETTVAIKLLSGKPSAPKAEDFDSGESGCELSSSKPQRCTSEMLDELDKEAAIMAGLRHPNVVMFLGVCLDPPCVVAEVLPLTQDSQPCDRSPPLQHCDKMTANPSPTVLPSNKATTTCWGYLPALLLRACPTALWHAC